ncbi:sigma-70 family RNA polymerase sigma factor [Roseibium denhamense]|uniref:RNA polymerase sigma-70 factor, ECF subfamily n=1 Tax=Roseibium denhamense TaxID=76305 RepID=A0ABY1P8X0_9HYPH|nr:sigma-70 family RNA polymerase sigma factor [Roseibium denhamense]MTI04488.1 sigma-70 family RNA polymerase sigma factor [Roseibium denhamense]SMP28675.1 RNA polymerase sigma-70 factor, ECF subfamily [Roseibium denhamense]
MAQTQYFSDLIVKVAVDRDKSAFVELFDHFAPRLKGYLMKQGADDAVAEEIAQDVMVTLWRKADLFDPKKSSASTWLFRVARNRRIDRLRRQKTAELDPEEPSLQPAAPADVAVEMDARLREKRVRVALSTLPDDQKQVVEMAFFLGLSHSEIADRTELPLGTVKSRIRLAFGRLRRLIEADEAVDVD